MSQSIFSARWHQFAKLKPKLKSNIDVHTQHIRGEYWTILQGHDDVTLRINSASYAVIGRFNGLFSIEEIWDAVMESEVEHAPTQDELINLLIELDQQDFLIYDSVQNINNLFKRKKRKQKELIKSFINPFAFRIPLWNPSSFLRHFEFIGPFIFNHIALILWLAVMMVGGLIAATHWSELFIHAKQNMVTPRYLIISWAVYPFIKALHEMSHAIAIKHWGGQVKEVGITLFMLTPAPYVNAADAQNFKRREHRIIVSLIGIMAELIIGVVALFIYINAQPGVVKDTAFVVAFISTVSTVIFNGNPLLKFDSYYALCDYFQLPNLASRSRAYWSNIMARYMVGNKAVNPIYTAEGEGKWLFFYAPLSLLYIVIVFSVLTLWLGKQSYIAAVLLGLLLVFSIILLPLYKMIRSILTLSSIAQRSIKAKVMLFSFGVCIMSLLFLVPAPRATLTQGVVWLQDDAYIRPESEGLLSEVYVSNNSFVTQGQLLMRLKNDDLQLEQANLQDTLEQLKVDHFDAMFNQPEKIVEIKEEINQLQLSINRNKEKIAKLDIYSQRNGYFVMPNKQDLLTSFLKQGDDIAYVLHPNDVRMRVAIPAEHIDLVKAHLLDIRVKLAEYISETLEAKLLLIHPAAFNQLPSAILGNNAGGDIATLPEDSEGMQTQKPVVWIDLGLPNISLDRVGGRAYVRFEHESEPIGFQFIRQLKQVFLGQFTPNNAL